MLVDRLADAGRFVHVFRQFEQAAEHDAEFRILTSMVLPRKCAIV
jgi:hypothetical protein